MSGYAVWTEVAIWLLVLGAPAIFAWFLKDAVRLVRGLGRGDGDRRARDVHRPSRGEGEEA